jgi:hypothetical protein
VNKFAVLCRRPKGCEARHACQAAFLAETPEQALTQAEEEVCSFWGQVRHPYCPDGMPVRLVVVAYPADGKGPLRRTGVTREYSETGGEVA